MPDTLTKADIFEAIRMENNTSMGKSPLSIEEMQKIAKSRGGRCLSETYEGSIAKLQWECSEKHTWWASPENVKRRTWCQTCAGNIKLTIEEMREIATFRGGCCLSKKYKDAHTKLDWQCAKGHKWKTTPKHIRSGTWCPICAKSR